MLEYKIIGEIYQYFVNSNKYFSNVGKSALYVERMEFVDFTVLS